jgi:U3 small nucleolar RNA-associated protein 15
MSNGLLAVKSRGNKDMAESRVKEKRDPRAGTYAYFIRGQADEAGDDDYRVERVRKQRLQPFDKLLKAFSYGPALDAAIVTQQPQVCPLGTLFCFPSPYSSHPCTPATSFLCSIH